MTVALRAPPTAIKLSCLNELMNKTHQLYQLSVSELNKKLILNYLVMILNFLTGVMIEEY